MPVTNNPSFDPMGRGSAAVSGALAPFGLGQTAPDPFMDTNAYHGGGLGLGQAPSFTGGRGLGMPAGVDPFVQMNMPGTDWSRALAQENADLAAQRAAQASGAGGRAGYPNVAGGSTASTGGGKWGALDAMNSDFADASRKTNVPANLIKAMLAIEGAYGSSWGQAPVWLADRGTYVNGFNGMLQSTAAANGYDWNRIQTDQAYAIWTSADVLQRLYATYGAQYGWDGVIKTYFSGNPTGVFANGSTSDEMGNESGAYHDNVKALWDELNAYGGTTDPSQPSVGGGTTGGSFNSIWGGAPANVTFEFHGRGGDDIYGYGNQYGLDGSEHTGIDVGLPLNSNLYAPVGGTITCAGTDNGPGSGPGSGGCSRFGDDYGSGNGRIEILLDNGDVLILGHTSVSRVTPGQRVNAGDLVGLSGGAGTGTHVHVEARVPDPSTPSGWRIVDARTILGGSGGAPGVTTPAAAAPGASDTIQDVMYRIMTGQGGYR